MISYDTDLISLIPAPQMEFLDLSKMDHGSLCSDKNAVQGYLCHVCMISSGWDIHCSMWPVQGQASLSHVLLRECCSDPNTAGTRITRHVIDDCVKRCTTQCLLFIGREGRYTKIVESMTSRLRTWRIGLIHSTPIPMASIFNRLSFIHTKVFDCIITSCAEMMSMCSYKCTYWDEIFFPWLFLTELFCDSNYVT